MTIRFLTQNGLTIGQAVQKILQDCKDELDKSGKTVSQALYHTTVNHIRARFPGSSHWNPDKVTDNTDGSVSVNIAGAARAYSDITIRPVKAKNLAIPIHAAAYGKKPSDFQGLFKIKGKKALFLKKNGGIVAMFALAKQAFQKRDETLLPSDQTYVKNIEIRLAKAVYHSIEKEIKQI